MKIPKALVLEYLAEFMATLLLAFFVYLAPIVAGGIEPFVIAFLFMVLWYGFSTMSKVQMNPAVSLGEYVVVLVRQIRNQKFDVADLFKFLGYILTQLLAFLLAFPFASWVRSQIIDFQMVKNGYEATDAIKISFLDQYNFSTVYTENFAGLAFALEFFGAFLLVFFFLKLTTSAKYKQYTGLVWGLVVFTVIIFASQLTGASYNPWRSLVPALSEGKDSLKFVAVYLTAPMLGGIVAGLVYSAMRFLEMPVKAVKGKK